MGPLRRLLIGLLGAAAACTALASTEAGTAVPDTDALTALLLADRTPAQLAQLVLERGCGPRGCQVRVDSLIIAQPSGALRTAAGRPVRLTTHRPPGLPLPQADWQPLAAYAVSVGGQPWGTCLELAHTGLGRSGSAQRWTSLVLVPAVANAPAAPRPAAHRFVGYWAACAQLWQPAGDAGRIALPLLGRANGAVHSAAFTETPWLCSARGCIASPAARRFAESTELPGGGLRWLP